MKQNGKSRLIGRKFARELDREELQKISGGCDGDLPSGSIKDLDPDVF